MLYPNVAKILSRRVGTAHHSLTEWLNLVGNAHPTRKLANFNQAASILTMVVKIEILKTYAINSKIYKKKTKTVKGDSF